MLSSRTALARVRKWVPEVEKVIDGKRDLFIKVTKADNRASKRGKHKECALAVACQKKYNADAVVISRSTAYIVKGKKATRFKLPESVSREVVSFDRGGGFDEGEYELHRPGPSSRLGARTGGKDKKPSSRDGSKSRRFVHKTGNVRFSLLEKH